MVLETLMTFLKVAILSCVFLIVCIAPTYASGKDMIIYGTRLQIEAQECSLLATKSTGDTKNINHQLPDEGVCQFITLANTNIPHVEFIDNSYILLMEVCFRSSAEGPAAEVTGIVVGEDGEVRASRKTSSSGKCNLDRDPKAFAYFASGID